MLRTKLPPRTRLTADEFTRLVDAGAFGTTRIELVNGRIYHLTQKLPHMVAISKAADVFVSLRKPNEWIINQGTLRLNPYSMPDPDLLWLPCPVGTEAHLWPNAILLIEISDTTYRKDGGVKLRNYAYHGVPEYWIENLKAGRIEVYRQPVNPTGHLRDCRYESVEHFVRGQTIRVSARPEVMVSVDDLLP